jgi:F-type H+-transporting ATPase subunit b
MLIFTEGLIDPQSITDKLIPNGIWPFVVQLLSTLVMLVIVYKFLYKPVKGILDKRAAFVEGQVNTAVEREQAAQAKLDELSALQQKTKKDLTSLRQAAQQEIEAQKARLLEEAQAQALALKQKTFEEIELAKKQAQASLETEMIDVAMAASEKVLARELTQKDHEKILKDFLKDLRQ